MYGNDHNYAASRLEGTVIMTTGGEPVMVYGVYPDMSLSVHIIAEGKDIKLPAEEAVYTPVQLGYVNMKRGDALYVVRKPMRRDWRQGMRKANVTVIGRQFNANNLNYKDMVPTMKGTFPAFNLVVDKFVNDMLDKSIAWCRDFALLPSGEIEYRGSHRVGYFNKKNGECVLKEEYTYLNEALEETLV